MGLLLNPICLILEDFRQVRANVPLRILLLTRFAYVNHI